MANHSKIEYNMANHSKIEYNERLSKITKENIIDASIFETLENFAAYHIEENSEKEKFSIINLKSVIRKYIEWQKELPMITPHYAVKCNPDIKILQVLSCLGCHFDCATQGELDIVLNKLGKYNVKPESIVYSNPVKKKDMIKYAINNNVYLTVFDSKEELLKLSKILSTISNANNIDLLLRIKIENEESICNLSNKFGCDIEEVSKLLKLSIMLNMNVVGVCFHVGSGCKNKHSYERAFKDTYKVFKIAKQLGIEMNIVDIGGGFNGKNTNHDDFKMPNFKEIASILRKSINKFEEKISNWETGHAKIKFISEPGRYFVSEATSIVTNVFFKKYDKEKDIQTLFIDDGIYGSFNNMMYDHSHPIPKKIRTDEKGSSQKKKGDEQIKTIVFGQYCDGLDQISNEKTKLPLCKVNDWLLWEDMGAYSHTSSYHFNGFSHVPKKIYIVL